MLNLSRVLDLARYQSATATEASDDAYDATWSQHVTQIEESSARQLERHFAERFARAMELIGDEKLEVRWGGIFALERMAQRSPQDQSEVSEVLATYVRRRAPWQPGREETEPNARIASEIQIIVTILSRRSFSFEGEDKPLDLHNTNLAKAHLPFARLQRTFFYNSNLQGALLFHAQLQGAWLARANLKNANLDGAHLESADLTDAEGMTIEQLQHAFWDDKTTLPKYLGELSMRRRSRRTRR